MKIRTEYVIISLCVAVLAVVVITLLPARAAGPLYVDKAGCNGATPCYSTLQGAINAATNGDEIRVRGEQNVPPGPGIMAKIKAKSLVIKGGWTSSWAQGGPNAYLNARSGGRVIALIGGSQVLLEKLTIANGFTPPLANLDDPELTGWYGRGGGLLVADGSRVDVVGCEFSGNDSVYIGGGASFEQGSGVSTVANSTFNGNFAAGSGGGIFNYRTNVVVDNSSFSGNWTGYSHGGALTFSLGSSQVMTATGNTFFANIATFGGAVSSIQGKLVFTNNSLVSNKASGVQQQPPQNSQAMSLSAAEVGAIAELKADNGKIIALGIYDGQGGAMHISNLNSASVVANNKIVYNSAATLGGGIYARDAEASYTNNVIVGNAGDGIYLVGLGGEGQGPRFDQNTIVGNTGYGLFLEENSGTSQPGTALGRNNLIANHTVGVVMGRGTTSFTNTLLFNTTNTQVINGGIANFVGTVNANPQLREDQIHLLSSSLAINAGVNTGVTADIDNTPWNTPYDIGADQFGASDPIFIFLLQTYLPLILK